MLPNPLRWYLEFQYDPRDVSKARKWTRSKLAGHECVDSAELIVAELAANAVIHAHSGFAVNLYAIGKFAVMVAVEDFAKSADSRPVFASDVSGCSESGRGLLLVRMLSCHVETHHDASGNCVLAVIASEFNTW